MTKSILSAAVVTLSLTLVTVAASAQQELSTTRFWAPLPTGETATEARIVVANETAESVRIDTTWGPLASFSAASLDSDLGALGVYHPFYCDCLCGGACVECERPQDQSIEIPAGGSHELSWQGLLSRVAVNGYGSCTELFAPTPGRYLFVVCPLDDSNCVETEVTLPATEPIRMVFTDTPTQPTCESRPDIAVRAARTALAWVDLTTSIGARLMACEPTAVVCHSDYDSAALSREPGGCDVHAWLRPGEAEVLINLPLPAGSAGGSMFRLWLEPFATRVTQLLFPQ